MQLINPKKEQGFTLIEMLVSVALFSVVLTATMGTIITIVDSNKKARSLMSVMTNLNFAIDSMTRSIKSGSNVDEDGNSFDLVYRGGDCLQTNQIKYSDSNAENFDREVVDYCWEVDEDGRGRITKKVPGTGANGLDLTSPDVDIQYLEFVQPGGRQPSVVIKMQGEVKISERVSSAFSIQTTVSQRQLNL